MAKAKVIEKVVKTVEGIQLTLTPQEASTLDLLCTMIGGSSSDSLRVYMDRIKVALRAAGGFCNLRDDNETNWFVSHGQSIVCADNTMNQLEKRKV